MIHEALHWEKDKRYFEILQIKNRAASEKLYPIMCRQSETNYVPPEGKNTKENEVRWLEWQAHRLAPRVLMPCDMFKKKALEIIEHPEVNDVLPFSCDALIESLSSFFMVSRIKGFIFLIRNCKRTSRNLTLTNPILRHTSRYLRMMKTKKTSYWECLECRAKHYASAYGFLWRTGIGPHPPHLWNTQDCTQTIMVKSKMTPTIIWGLMFLWRFA